MPYFVLHLTVPLFRLVVERLWCGAVVAPKHGVTEVLHLCSFYYRELRLCVDFPIPWHSNVLFLDFFYVRVFVAYGLRLCACFSLIVSFSSRLLNLVVIFIIWLLYTCFQARHSFLNIRRAHLHRCKSLATLWRNISEIFPFNFCASWLNLKKWLAAVVAPVTAQSVWCVRTHT